MNKIQTFKEKLNKSIETYYPYNIDYYTQEIEYKNSIEYKNFVKKVENRPNEIGLSQELEKITSMLRSFYNFKFQDMIIPHHLDPCFNFQISKITNGNYYLIILLRSVISPIYFLRAFTCRVNAEKNKSTSPLIQIEDPFVSEIRNEFEEINNYLSNNLRLTPFPPSYYHVTLPNYSSPERSIGNLKIFQALFIDQDIYFE